MWLHTSSCNQYTSSWMVPGPAAVVSVFSESGCCCAGCCIRSGRTRTWNSWSSRPRCWAATPQSVCPSGTCEFNDNTSTQTQREKTDEIRLKKKKEQIILTLSLMFIVNKSHEKTKTNIVSSPESDGCHEGAQAQTHLTHFLSFSLTSYMNFNFFPTCSLMWAWLNLFSKVKLDLRAFKESLLCEEPLVWVWTWDLLNNVVGYVWWRPVCFSAER